MRFAVLTVFIYGATAPRVMGFAPSLSRNAFQTVGGVTTNLPSKHRENRLVGLNMVEVKLPTREQAAEDSFMQQISHAGELVACLNENHPEVDDQMMVELLTAQLSHVDGLRGFFATYLTESGETVADQNEIPQVLWEAMQNVDQKQLIDIACMNVVMPTAMMSLHTDASMSASAAKTAERAKIILRKLSKSKILQQNIEGILSAASNDESKESESAKYWSRFMEKYEYGEIQKENIATAISDLS